MKLRPELYHTHVNLAKAYEQQNNLDQAVKEMDRAIEQAPGQSSLYRTRARFHLQAQKPGGGNARLPDGDSVGGERPGADPG